MKENLILEALHHDIEVPSSSVVFLWFSAPTNLNRKFVNNGTKVTKFRDTINSAIELTCNIAFDGLIHQERETRKKLKRYVEAQDVPRRLGKGFKKNVLGIRSGKCNRTACQITMFQSYECTETQDT